MNPGSRIPMYAMAGLGIIVSAFLLISQLQEKNEDQSSAPLRGSRTANNPPSPAIQSDGTFGSESKILPQGKYARDALIQSNPDAYYDPERRDAAYETRLRRHREISRFTSSTRRNDPAYRKIMMLLLENGYDVKDWSEAISILGVYHLPVVASRNQMMAEGFSPAQIEADLEIPRRHQKRMLEMVYENFADRIGITDRKFVDSLIGVEIEFENQEEIIGDGALRMIRGDKLLTEADWLDSELDAARTKYQGPRRPPARVSLGAPVPQIQASGRLPTGPLPNP